MKYIVFISFLFLTACSTKDATKNTTLDTDFNKVTFFNKTDLVIEDVHVYSQDTHKKMSCSLIPVNAPCSYKFKAKMQNNNNIIISWKYNNLLYEYKEKIRDLDSNKAVSIKIDIFRNGKVSISKL